MRAILVQMAIDYVVWVCSPYGCDHWTGMWIPNISPPDSHASFLFLVFGGCLCLSDVPWLCVSDSDC